MFNKILNILKNKNLIVSSIFILFISMLFSYPSIKASFMTAYYKGSDLLSNVAAKNERIIESGNKGVFTYGPYINLDKGNYNITIYYRAEYDNHFDITSGFGALKLAKGLLKSSENKISININIDSPIENKGFEVRTFYNGKGLLEIEKIAIDYNQINLEGFIVAITFLLLSVIGVFLNRKDYKFNYIVLCYLSIVFFMLYEYIKNSFIYSIVIVIAIMLILLLISIFKDYISRSFKNIANPEEILCILISSYIFAMNIIILKTFNHLDSLKFVEETSISELCFISLLVCHIIFLLRSLIARKNITYWIFLLSSSIFGFLVIIESTRDIYLTIGVVAILGYIIYYFCNDDKLGINNFKLSYKVVFIIVTIGFLIVSIYFGWQTSMRHKTFSNSTFDFGIFAQMYEYMSRTGMPLTTCERDTLLSHFYIHFSPIYYLILPIYMIFRTPETLLYIQSFLVLSAVFPVFMFLKKYNVRPFVILIISFTYLFYPGILMPLFYDFHENAFLTVLILWMIYFFENKNYKIMYLFAFLILMVKEDAAIYTIFISLYYIIAKKEYKAGFITLLFSIIYFSVVLSIIQMFGMGLMEGHYGLYYLTGESGVLDMVKNIILNIGFFVNNIFTQDTFIFIIYMFAPLIFIPLINKNLKSLILLIPMVAINLMTDYKYQHDIGYQYVFGTSALVIFLYITNIKRLNQNWQNIVCIICVISSALFTYTYKGDGLYLYSKYYERDTVSINETEQALKLIPDSVSVTASHNIVPHLYDKEILYQYPTSNVTDYIILQRDIIKNYESIKKELINKGYIKIYSGSRIDMFKTEEAPGLN